MKTIFFDFAKSQTMFANRKTKLANVHTSPNACRPSLPNFPPKLANLQQLQYGKQMHMFVKTQVLKTINMHINVASFANQVVA